jgi:hypothetical protein
VLAGLVLALDLVDNRLGGRLKLLAAGVHCHSVEQKVGEIVVVGARVAYIWCFGVQFIKKPVLNGMLPTIVSQYHRRAPQPASD